MGLGWVLDGIGIGLGWDWDGMGIGMGLEWDWGGPKPFGLDPTSYQNRKHFFIENLAEICFFIY